MNDNRPIGIFDSGVGGLTVYKELRKQLPHEDIIYFADSDRAPFGGKSEAALKRYAKEIVEFLLSQDVKLIVIACNTICAVAYDYLRQTFDIPMIELIDTSVYEAGRITQTNHIGVLATAASINSGVFAKKITANGFIPHPQAAPLLVPLIEENLTADEITLPFLHLYLDVLSRDIDTLILGCTHYPLLSSQIHNLYPSLSIINPAGTAALNAKTYLQTHGLLKAGTDITGTSLFYTSKDTEKFNHLYFTFLNKEITSRLHRLGEK